MVLTFKVNIFVDMEALKVDVTKLKTISSYARDSNVSVTTVYNWIKDGRVKVREIDGVRFIIVA